ncbi:MAG: hypothetical protein F9K29_02510 [Hyphomicrobiaceae bacterium]|nr:MAG: hypothetical protein F9K29_02510 [Hyphomicrobiaceae bacterium]
MTGEPNTRRDRDSEPRREARIIPFRPRTPPSKPKPHEPPLADPMRRLEKDEDRRRMQQNAAAALVLIVLLVAGAWLIDRLRTSARVLACIEAGHRNCIPVEQEPRPPR